MRVGVAWEYFFLSNGRLMKSSLTELRHGTSKSISYV